MRPNFLKSRTAPVPLERPPEPTVADHLRGAGDTPLTPEQRMGLGVQAELARRHIEDARLAAEARSEAAKREQEERDRLWADYCRRVGRLVEPV